MKATIYVRVNNIAAWKRLGPNPASWVNDKLEAEFKAPHPKVIKDSPLDKLIT